MLILGTPLKRIVQKGQSRLRQTRPQPLPAAPSALYPRRQIEQRNFEMRPSGRELNEMRPVSIETNVTKHAEGSCMIRMGDTHVLCTATLEDRVPPFIKGSGLGWVTAEYGMLPRSTTSRMRREAAMGKQGGRTVEIQRLIGRSLRAGVDRSALGERQITVDCDVIQADGGTRCASITGGWVALKLAVQKLMKTGQVTSDPLISPVAAVSCGIYASQPVLDLDYPEDSEAGVDGNFIMLGNGQMIETQMSAEGATYSRDQMNQLLDLAEKGVAELVAAQMAAVNA
jgi:ribonuclease PH